MSASSKDDDYVFRIGVAIMDGAAVIATLAVLVGAAGVFLGTIASLP